VTLAVDSMRTDLAALVGASRMDAGAAVCAPLEVDGAIPDVAVFPDKAEQVAAVLHFASEHRLALIPRGYGTKISLGTRPRRYDIALSVRELKRVIHYEPADLTIGVEAGMTLAEFQTLVGKNGLWLPLDPRGGAESSIGGIIAANAAGPLRQGFGGPRDMVIGLKIATTDGKIAKTGGRVVKNVAGYDLGKLLTGSMGTLGVIVEANLKLFPKPPERATFAIPVGSMDAARDLRRSILRSPLDPMRLLLLDATAVALVDGAVKVPETPAAELWIELGGSHRVIERCMLELRHLASGVGATLARREDAELAWEKVSNLAHWLQPKYRDVTVLKVALPLAATEEFMRRARQAAESENISIAAFAQVGVGLLHLCVLQETLGSNTAAWVVRQRQAATELRGSLVIEHCPLDLKGQVDVWGAHGDDLEAMRKMKVAWDPQAVLSPGRFVDGI
jgi:glycolate oxidase FAD binding subunit